MYTEYITFNLVFIRAKEALTVLRSGEMLSGRVLPLSSPLPPLSRGGLLEVGSLVGSFSGGTLGGPDSSSSDSLLLLEPAKNFFSKKCS